MPVSGSVAQAGGFPAGRLCQGARAVFGSFPARRGNVPEHLLDAQAERNAWFSIAAAVRKPTVAYWRLKNQFQWSSGGVPVQFSSGAVREVSFEGGKGLPSPCRVCRPPAAA